MSPVHEYGTVRYAVLYGTVRYGMVRNVKISVFFEFRIESFILNVCLLRPCVPVTVSDFGIISGKCTGKTGTFLPVHSGTFPYRTSLSTGVPFRKPENVPKIFPKQGYENVQNPCRKSKNWPNTYIPKTLSKPS